jgi:WhiB family redox-sensing transcriptional regulator
MVVIPDWHVSAACATADPNIFFPAGYGERNVKRALAWCNGCSVSSLCLQESIDDWQEYGIFGGKTPAQRRKIAGHAKYRRRQSPRLLSPHPSPGAVTRHRRAQEPLCEPCRTWLIPIKRQEKARRKARKEQERLAS